MPKRKDALIIAAVLVIAAALLLVSRLMPKTNLEEKTADVTLAPDAIEYLDAAEAPTAEPTPTPTPTIGATIAETATPVAEQTATPTAEPTQVPTAEPTEAPAEELAQPAMVGPMPAPQTQAVKGHVVITVGNRQYGDPIPMDREKVITIKQDNGQINKVHITPEGAWMEYSTCDNQDCVGQGHITMDNYKTRILSTFVICLPNNVTVEMVPVE